MKLWDKLNETNSRVMKESALRKYAGEMEQRALLYTYDPYKMFHIKNVGEICFSDLGEPNEAMFTLLDKLNKREWTGDYARLQVTKFAAQYGDLIKLVLAKSLKCGISAKTINKVFTNMIPTFQIQKAKERDINLLHYPQYCQLKYDGVRLIARKEDGVVQFRSSGGRLAEFPVLNELLRESSLPDIVLDGELVWASGKTDERTKVSGLLNSAMHGGKVNEEHLKFVVFDAMSLGEFDFQRCTRGYVQRISQVVTLVHDYIGSPEVEVAQTKLVESPQEVNRLYDSYVKNGQEGVILKEPNSLYTFKRSNDWVKVKEVIDVDLRCIGTNEGTGRNEGLIGALVCEGTINGKFIRVNVGTGLSDADRAKDPEYYIEEIIEIQYNSLIKDSVTKEYSLFLPRFITVRTDK